MLGRCSCGAVEYELQADPILTHCCHCTQCQRHTGSAFVVNALVELDHIKLIKGDVVKVPLSAPDAKPKAVQRCRHCAVALWSEAGKVAFLRVGTLDAPEACPPGVHIFTSTKQPWVKLPDDVPSFENFYEPDAFWQGEVRDRMAAVGWI